MISAIQKYCDDLSSSFSEISVKRQVLLKQIADYILSKHAQNKTAHLIFICTHNSRRSHFGQIWATIAANYYVTNNICTYSGGTESTSFNTNAIESLRKIGFKITAQSKLNNPIYDVSYSEDESSIECFSKVFNHPNNPSKEFLAIMTCEEAEKECPFVPGAELRIACPYEDPKIYDGTNLQESMYEARCREIALEMFYVFSLLNK